MIGDESEGDDCGEVTPSYSMDETRCRYNKYYYAFPTNARVQWGIIILLLRCGSLVGDSNFRSYL